MCEFNYDNIDAAERVARRASDLCFAPALGDQMGFMMDLLAADGENGNPPLDLDRLETEFDDANFLHDVAGITATMDRKTGKLGDCFIPRCVKPRELAEK